MDEFCTTFQNIEMQISNNELTLKSRLDIFMRSVPPEIRSWETFSGAPTSMDAVYQIACRWARKQNQHPQRIERLRTQDRD